MRFLNALYTYNIVINKHLILFTINYYIDAPFVTNIEFLNFELNCNVLK